MKNLLRKFILWTLNSGEQKMMQAAVSIDSESTSTAADSKLRLGFIKAMNGTIVEVSVQKHNPHGPDWKHELYIVRDGESLNDAIKVILATKALEQ
jgi:hypothetical protein